MKKHERARAFNTHRGEERRCAYRILMGKPQGRRPPVRPTSKWEDNIKIGRKAVGRGH
jgi:hypothetical protein